MEYGQVEPMSPFERILEIPSGECTVDVGIEPIAQSPSDEHARDDDDGAGPRQAQQPIGRKPLHHLFRPPEQKAARPCRLRIISKRTPGLLVKPMLCAV